MILALQWGQHSVRLEMETPQLRQLKIIFCCLL
jgi:hypothetical protein